METVHPTLLIGPSDWDAGRMPREEFRARIDALWRAIPDATRAIVYGNPRHHSELAWLTNFLPKLEAAIAIIPRAGEPRLLVGGGPNMIGAARPLTWIKDVLPLRDVGQAVKGDGAVAVVGGEYMPVSLRRIIDDALGEMGQNATARLWPLMRRKSPAELAAIRESCLILQAAIEAIAQAKRSGAGVTAAILAGERAAIERGAQDVRTLFSRNGGRTLQPFVALDSRAIEPLQVYVAVRRFNYWAEGFSLLTDAPHPESAKAVSALRAVVARIKGGTKSDGIARLISAGIGPYRAHPVTERAFAHSIGIALEEPPHTDLGAAFEAGEVYTLCVGVSDGGGRHAIASAMIAVRNSENDVLWSTEA